MPKLNILLLMTFYSATLCAAQSGSLGLSSTGSASISFTKHALVQVSKLDDFNLNKPSSLGGDIWHDDICIVSTSGAYKIVTYSKKGGASAYRMSNENVSKSIDYSINFSPDNNAATGDMLRPGVESGVYAGAYQDGCSGGVNSRVFLSVDKNSLNAADPGEYVDVLTFIVHPL